MCVAGKTNVDDIFYYVMLTDPGDKCDMLSETLADVSTLVVVESDTTIRQGRQWNQGNMFL